MSTHVELVDTLNSIYKLPEIEIGVLLNHFVDEEYPSNYRIGKIGDLTDKIYYVEKGIIRHYLMDKKGNEINSWFSFEGNLAASFKSFSSRTPSLEGMELIEDCKLRSITYQSVYQLMDKYHELERLFRLFTEYYYMEAEARIHELKTLTATERYHKLIEDRPDILQRISLNHIASFIGITKETLSRVRRTKEKKVLH